MKDMEIKTTNYGVCKVSKGYYPSNGNMWLILTDADGQQVTVITSNIIPLADGEFCGNITNIGKTLWDDIVASGLIEDTGEKVPSGYCEFPVCKLVKELV